MDRSGRSGQFSTIPNANASILRANLGRDGTLKIYPRLPHGMLTSHANVLDAALPFVES